MTTADHARAAVEDLIAQLDHADRLITEQSERIDRLACENRHLREALILARRVIDPEQHDVLEEIDMTLYGDLADVPPAFPATVPRMGGRAGTAATSSRPSHDRIGENRP